MESYNILFHSIRGTGTKRDYSPGTFVLYTIVLVIKILMILIKITRKLYKPTAPFIQYCRILINIIYF